MIRKIMKKLFILFSLIGVLFAAEIKDIKSIKDLSSTKDIILMFSIDSCPWCIRQEKVLKDIQEQKDIQIVKVKNGSDIYKELVEKYPFPIAYYPTSFIVTKEDGKLNISYEFRGYQKKSNIIEVLENKDEFLMD